MSGAIFGKVNLSNILINKDLANNMMNKLSVYKFDQKKIFSLENVCMGCGLLHITDENIHEILPYYDKQNKLVITADAILDNREELIEGLNLNIDEIKNITDSQLILKAYVKWKYDCVKYLLGDYAFVIFDKHNNEVFCATDYTGCRTLYYKFKNNSFSFSTLIKPIYEGENINERWLSDFIALPAVLHQSESEETIYDEIYQLEAATIMIVKNDGIKKIKYWDPVRDSKKISLDSDEEYVKKFMKIFTDAVKCRLRTNHNVAVSMSGGLDSTSVACVAAEILKKSNKKILSFTSVPGENYIDKTSSNFIADESEYVDAIGNMYNNIEINYCRSEGINSISEMDNLLKVLEIPYKTFQNSFWCSEIMKRVSKNGCKIQLTGQFGNYTISYGDFFTNMKTLLKDKRYLKFFQEINGCSRLHNISVFYTLKYVLKTIFSNRTDNENHLYDSPINKKLLSKWNIRDRFEKGGFIIKNNQLNDMYSERKIMTAPWIFTQISTIETKLALYNGIIQRDPTKDKRVIEFCFGIDGDQYVRNGLDRYLIRRAMKGIIPEKIRLIQGKKGLQGADWLQRMKSEHKYILNTLNKCIYDEKCSKYLDIDKIKNQIKILNKESIDSKLLDVKTIFMSINLYKFFNEEKSDITLQSKEI